MVELRTKVDESTVLVEHFNRKRNRWLKEMAHFKDKVRMEEDPSLANRRELLETEYQQTVVQLKDLTRRVQEAEKLRGLQKNEVEQLTGTYEKLEDELHELVLNNLRLECNLRTIEEQIILHQSIYETEKAELGNQTVRCAKSILIVVFTFVFRQRTIETEKILQQ